MTDDNLPGEPDHYDIDKIRGYLGPDLTVSIAKQHAIAGAYAVALGLWAGVVLLTLCAFIFTGSLFFWCVGYAVTVPYLVVGYKYRNVIDYAEELQALCHIEC